MIGQIISINDKPYLVYKDGTVKSFDTSVHHWRGGKKVMKGTTLKHVNRKGYMYVHVSTNGISQQKAVHRLVAQTFIPNPKNKPCVNHKNTIKTDNRVENLEWVTSSENMQHALKNNLIKKRFGKDNPATKLSNEQKLYVKRLLIYGATQKKVAELFNVSSALICNIKYS